MDIFQLSILELSPDSSVGSDQLDFSPVFFHIERFMEGEYRKYNSNSGFVDECLRNTPQVCVLDKSFYLKQSSYY